VTSVKDQLTSCLHILQKVLCKTEVLDVNPTLNLCHTCEMDALSRQSRSAH